MTSYRGRQHDAEDWTLDEETLVDRSLQQVLLEGEPDWDRSMPLAQISLKLAPPGYRAMCRALAREFGMSYSQFKRLTTMHGTAVLDADHRMKELREVYVRARSLAMDSGDHRALTRLDAIETYTFDRTERVRTSFYTYPWVKGKLSELAETCGVHDTTIAVISVLASLLTLPNERGYRQIILQEMDAFWDWVGRRTQVLSLPDR